jgi:hypothetical protein
LQLVGQAVSPADPYFKLLLLHHFQPANAQSIHVQLSNLKRAYFRLADHQPPNRQSADRERTERDRAYSESTNRNSTGPEFAHLRA